MQNADIWQLQKSSWKSQTPAVATLNNTVHKMWAAEQTGSDDKCLFHVIHQNLPSIQTTKLRNSLYKMSKKCSR